MVDITDFKLTTRDVEILNPRTDEPLGIRVTLRSIDDDRLKQLKRDIIDKQQKLQQRNKTFKAVELESNADMIMFTACDGWEWYNPTGKEGDEGYDPDAQAKFNGEVPMFNQKNFMAVIKLPWFRQQLNAEMDETKAFFEVSGSI